MSPALPGPAEGIEEGPAVGRAPLASDSGPTLSVRGLGACRAQLKDFRVIDSEVTRSPEKILDISILSASAPIAHQVRIERFKHQSCFIVVIEIENHMLFELSCEIVSIFPSLSHTHIQLDRSFPSLLSSSAHVVYNGNQPTRLEPTPRERFARPRLPCSIRRRAPRGLPYPGPGGRGLPRR